jgi:hypothetical protein
MGFLKEIRGIAEYNPSFIPNRIGINRTLIELVLIDIEEGQKHSRR